MLYDLVIIGGGPAGCASAVYAARKQLKTLFVIKNWGGQSIVSEDIQNWIGTPHISGTQLAEKLKEHVLEYKGESVSIVEGNNVVDITDTTGNFTITLENKETYTSKTVLITSGSSRKKLTIPGAEKFENKGVTYCASCDGPLFSGMDVVVVGGGNAGFESASQLLAYCKSVTLISRSEPSADPITIKKLNARNNFKLIINASLEEIKGSDFVEAITYTDATGNTVSVPTSAIFVEIGQSPNTSFVKNILKLDKNNHIIIDPRTQQTSTEGIWAAGDCTDVLYNQNNIAIGDALRALEDIYLHIHT